MATNVVELVFGIAIGAIAIAFVGRPLYLARARGWIEMAPSAQGLQAESLQRDVEALLAQRDAIYESIREVDLDRELGRVSPEDHERHRREYVTQAADVLRRIDHLGDGLGRRIEREVARLRDGRQSGPEVACPHCGAPRAESDRFCPSCGRRLDAPCPHCGAPVGAGDRFCRECGNRLEGDSP